MAKSTTAPDETRRDFLVLATGAVAAFGVAAVAWPFLDSMNPTADVLALGSVKVDISAIEVGQAITIKWRGKPIFIRRRTQPEIEESRAVPMEDLKDPQKDQDRVKDGKAEWLIMVGICTHLGCIPKGQRPGDEKGEFGGWFCPCHGSHYDKSGRIRRGPAPTNLVVPAYEFLPDNIVKIG
jgi:ubiquinol-cytochrome c reductase iron-sulfur subunit